MEELQSFLGFDIHTDKVAYQVLEKEQLDGFERQLISYLGSEADEIRAYLFLPRNQEIKGSILVHHQHSGKRHLGKSEVAGILGDPFQFFCPALVKRGFICLAPDSICFEDRRTNMSGTEEAEDPDDDWLQHYNEMCYRLVQGESLMKKVIDDASIAISLLSQLPETILGKIGVLGHSYGGNTVIFQSPFDSRIGYSCSSGAACSYSRKLADGIGIEMAEVIPGFSAKYDIGDLLKGIAPRKFLIMSADQDKYSRDAEDIFQAVSAHAKKSGHQHAIDHKSFTGKHGLDQERFDYIINWFVREMKS